ncbi:MAG: tRNA uridine-5-carboxymethylaminomethyl(34) synthesis GTPase MnmE [Rikenellaceae bacterium]
MNFDTIVALSTGQGGAISVIRLSGADSITITDKIFSSINGKKLVEKKGNSATFGVINDEEGETIDEVVVTLFRSPRSYTGEDIVEISCHASSYIVQRIIELIIENGARIAEPGEFTQRAYLAGKLDLIQAEAVADIIASNSAASHRMALNQIKGGYSQEFKELRDELLHLVSMLELELDFGEEDVEFADRKGLTLLLDKINNKLDRLISSFKYGNAMKNGVPTAIVGEPNAGKSTLLNRFLGEERAIVSHIAGTTRDSIEECITLGGVLFRFIDTAGIRTTSDHVEALGIERTFKKIKEADLIILLIDATSIEPLISIGEISPDQNQTVIVAINKSDLADSNQIDIIENSIAQKFGYKTFNISAKENKDVEQIENFLANDYTKSLKSEQIAISNLRHLELLKKAYDTSTRAYNLLQTSAPTDLIATDARQTITHISSIIGEITPDDILGNIFSKFCIGK